MQRKEKRKGGMEKPNGNTCDKPSTENIRKTGEEIQKK